MPTFSICYIKPSCFLILWKIIPKILVYTKLLASFFLKIFTRSRNRTNRIDFLFVTLRPPASLSCEKNLTKIFGYLTSCKKTCYRVSVWKVYLCSHITSQHNNFEPSLDVKTTKYVLETILILLCILLYCILLVTVLLSQLSI